jgi:thioester reductase-like protein
MYSTGTLNVMELAVTGSQIKSFFHASTLLANQKVNLEENRMSEEWYSPEEVFQLKNTGYPVSKFICEVILKQLSDRGVPVHIFRYPALFGDSRTGRFTLQNNHAVIRLLGFCKLGAIPAIPLPIQVLPSDLAADLTLEIFFRDDSPTGVYNVSNPHLNYFHDFAKVSGDQGFPIEVHGFII